MSLRIFVTGGSGELGTAVLAELSRRGHTVFNLDQQPPHGPSPTRFMRVDFRDYGQCVDALALRDIGWPHADALVHLAAIPGHSHAPDTALFTNNLQSTFNVWRAALQVGLHNIVWASSETLLGVPFEEPPVRLPLDESISLPQSSYSLAKHLEEEMARQLCRQHPALKLLALRLSYVHSDEELQRLRDDVAQRQAQPLYQAWNLWSYISARDAARAVADAVALPLRGTDQLLIANDDTIMPQPTRELLAHAFAQLAVPDSVQGHQSLIDCRKAEQVLGWRPQHGWRTLAPSR